MRPHQPRHRALRLEDLLHVAPIGHRTLKPARISLSAGAACMSEKPITRSSYGATIRSILPSKKRADARLVLPRARQAHGAAADVDDALFLPQQVQPLGGFFVESDGALGVGRSFVLPGLRAGQCVGVRSAGLAHLQGACTGGFKSRLPGM